LSPIGIKIDSTRTAIGALDVFDVRNVNFLPFKVFILRFVMFVELLDKFIEWRKALGTLI
jgi:hypothetical protein